MSVTAAVREELAHVEQGRDCCVRAELSALLRLGGSVTLSERGIGYTFETSTGAVVRRARIALDRIHGVRRDDRVEEWIEVHAPGGLHAATRYRLRLAGAVAPVLTDLGLLNRTGRPVDGIAPRLSRRRCDAIASVRGALMAAGSVTDPEGAPHLEIRAAGKATATTLAQLLVRCGGAGARAALKDGQWRVVVKSGEAAGAVLATAGAHTAFLRWDAARLRRELRGEANRAANADRANLARAVSASARQVAAIQQALATLDWEQLAPEMRDAALARLANPEASLAEVGGLLEPPVGKATVHRRLARLASLAEQSAPAGGSRLR
ncbi:MAG: DNA-binding protein WhiA [Nitriliruptorales bacterium]|nr:DNA-binding protein WhiA [Nitriliruptorales bacterium]